MHVMLTTHRSVLDDMDLTVRLCQKRHESNITLALKNALKNEWSIVRKT